MRFNGQSGKKVEPRNDRANQEVLSDGLSVDVVAEAHRRIEGACPPTCRRGRLNLKPCLTNEKSGE